VQVESFFFGLRGVPALRQRAAALAFRASFVARIEDVARRAGVLSAACGALAGSARLARVLAVVTAIISQLHSGQHHPGGGSGSGGSGSGGVPPRVVVTLLTLPTLKDVTDASGQRGLLQHVVAVLLQEDPDAAALGADGELAPLAAAAAPDAGLDTLPGDVAALARELAGVEALLGHDSEASGGGGDGSGGGSGGGGGGSSSSSSGGDGDGGGGDLLLEVDLAAPSAALSAAAPLPRFLAAARDALAETARTQAAAQAAFVALLAAHGDAEQGGAAGGAHHAPTAAVVGAKPEAALRSLHVDSVAHVARLRATLMAKAAAAAKRCAAAAGGGGGAGVRRT
jgi:hypothetical protein